MNMVDVSNTPHHVTIEELSEVLCAATERDAAPFFRVLACYYMGIMASCMRAKIDSPAFGLIPINNYAIALATSGFGKGKSTGLMENHVLCDFRSTFRDFLMPDRAEANIVRRANQYAAISGNDEADEEKKLRKEFESFGSYPFVFDGGSEAAIKQIRQMLLLADCGAINLQIDEIGTNLDKVGTTEALATYLELYDLGMIKPKLKMNTSEAKRGKEIEGMTPANMLLFGTPAKLLDSGILERKFYSMLETGYARRCLFAWADDSTAMALTDNEDEIYERLTNPANKAAIEKWRQHFASLADPDKFNWVVSTTEDVDKLILRYQLSCKKRALELSEFDEVRRAELTHRYFRVMKVAGTFAFVEETMTMTTDHVHQAIKVVEESGESFQKMLNREPAHTKLARYIAASGKELTHAELFNDLPFFKAAGKGERGDMITMATAWGYKNHIIVKKSFFDGVELLSGEALRETSLDAIDVSYSTDFTFKYQADTAGFDQLHILATAPDMNWTVHSFNGGHRSEENAIPGFNLLVLDVDGTASLQTVHELMEDYAFMTYTTKRHTPDANRFRLVLPMNYELKLDRDEYREFMQGIFDWLPFSVDEAAKDRSRKWASFEHAQVHYNVGETTRLLDVLPFVPKTSLNEKHREEIQELASYDNLERWFAQRIASGNRNNQFIKFALALVDSGMNYQEVENRVLAFNGKLNTPLSVDELRNTVLVTAAKTIQMRTP